ncbi:aminotransferase class I/II-fold pyridoxal phosphate-dependent enzyme [Pseudoduganella umbonata]|uniref:8-amino-7-oxononanoate synthase n=1 Tax=Pseudoduganella umbonata TaxID=864828 RepID=A0A7W5E953_9BURK|nr:aminotransferase class I/II-fold pyridoxal phosphate-dependent enzyme [Pseudoduganella umbonata]MBB3220040.1 8-amino-7-oxononanoate synthase [Pseudoduganella umbonata]
MGADAAADFTSALYLGLRHGRATLDDWPALTLGKPAALAEVPGARAVARELAQLQGCAAATLLPSTLHLFWDLFGMLGRQREGRPYTVLVDGAAYPVARWGAERATGMGLPLRVFRSGALPELAVLVSQARNLGRRPLILADGYYPGHADAPPLARYAALAARADGLLLLDDTQALGVLGRRGGGSVAAHGLAGAPVLVGASLAKGFGVPLAVLAGSTALVRRFESVSDMRLHASPPAVATVVAARHALALNAACGDALRATLRQRIGEFRAALAARGIAAEGGAFPVQAVRLPRRLDLAPAHAALRREGVMAVPQCRGGAALLAFLLRADHTKADIARAAQALRHHVKELA